MSACNKMQYDICALMRPFESECGNFRFESSRFFFSSSESLTSLKYVQKRHNRAHDGLARRQKRNSIAAM